MTNLQKIIKLSPKDSKEFAQYIIKTRALFITTPQNNVKNAYLSNKAQLHALLKNHKISQFIYQLRFYAGNTYIFKLLET